MNHTSSLRLLCAEADREALEPLLKALGQQGGRVKNVSSNLRNGECVLAVLSASFYADSARRQQLLDRIGSGAEHVIPLILDETAIPEELQNALYASNMLFAKGREPAELAERILDSLPARKKSALPRVLLGLAVILLVAGGVVLATRVWEKWLPPQPSEEETEATQAPTEPLPDYPLPVGLSTADLKRVRCAVFVGEHYRFYTDSERLVKDSTSAAWPDMCELLAVEDSGDGEETNWYWKEDGSAVQMTAYDLRFLELLPNLEEIHMAKIEVAQTPDLSKLGKMHIFRARDCELGDVSWLADSYLFDCYLRCPVDYAPLGQCRTLQMAVLEVLPGTPTDFGAFTPPKMDCFDLTWRAEEDANLSALSACPRLESVALRYVPVENLDFLEGKTGLRELRCTDLRELTDISAVRSLIGLRQLHLDECSSIEDYSPIAGCVQLQDLMLYVGWDETLTDASFLNGLKELTRIQLYSVDLPDLDFLKEIGEDRSFMESFRLSGKVADLSGLTAFERYYELSLNAYGDDIRQGLPDFSNMIVERFELNRISNTDMARLPQVRRELVLHDCDIRDLSALAKNDLLTSLWLYDCIDLRSLEGLQQLPEIGKYGSLYISGCPLLSDWSALEGMRLARLELHGMITAPDFSTIIVNELTLDQVEAIRDLSFLDAFDPRTPISLDLSGLEGVTNLAPLQRHRGEYLIVSPELEEQAQELVSTGHYKRYEVRYPSGGWDLNGIFYKLSDLEELETTPKALLRHVYDLRLVGDTVLDPEQYTIRYDGDPNGEDPVRVSLIDRESGESFETEPGTYADLYFLADLEELEWLQITNVPLTTLDGVQTLPHLVRLDCYMCTELTDVSAAFTLQELDELILAWTAVSSLDGIQNLTRLMVLDISYTDVTDLTPLLKTPGLQTLRLSEDMQAALNSLAGKEYTFEIEWEGH